MDVLSLVRVMCCQVEVSATGRSLVQRISTECGVLSVMWKPQQWGGLGPLGLSSHEKIYIFKSDRGNQECRQHCIATLLCSNSCTWR